MNVTLHGVNGYDYQYYASAYLILFFCNRNTNGSQLDEVFIDKDGHEDLLLAFKSDKHTSPVNLEFECKDRTGDFDELFLRECLSKFTARRNDSFILSRIQEGSIDFMCFFTSARVANNVEELNLIATEDDLLHPRTKIQKSKPAGLQKSLGEAFGKGTTDRDKFGSAFLAGLSLDDFRAILEKVSVIDLQSVELVQHKLAVELRTLGVPEVNHKKAIEKLYWLVKGSTKSGKNILQDVKDLIATFARRRAPLGANYIHRSIEKTLIDELRSNKFVLLEGTSLCGKTQTAYAIVNQILGENGGFEYQVKMDVTSADQFLFGNMVGGKICYLEDPFGQYGDTLDFDLVKKMNSLIENVAGTDGRLLICTCNSEVVNAIKASSFDIYPWHNLTITDRHFLVDAWEAVCHEVGVKSSFVKQVKGLLERTLQERELFQLGQLRALANLEVPKEGFSVEVIRNKANIKAKEVAKSLVQDRRHITMMSLLGAAATTQTGINDIDLAYLFDGDSEYFPGINKFDPRSVGGSVFGDETSQHKLRVYRKHNKRSTINESREDLSVLIDLNYIVLSEGHYFFSHPIYQEAGRLLLADKNALRFDANMKLLHKLIGSLNENAALQAVKSLYVIFEGQRTEDEKRQLLDLAAIAGKSTFVTVRDQSALFLARKFHFLPLEQQRDFIRNFNRKSDFADNIYRWDDEVVFIPEVDNIEFDRDYFEMRKGVAEMTVEWNRYVTYQTKLSPKDAFRLLTGIIDMAERQTRVRLDVQALKLFLDYQQLFIQEMAAFLIAASLDDGTFAVLDHIEFEDNPYVKYQLIRGLFRSYPYFKKDDIKLRAESFLKSNFDELFVVVRAIPLFTQFASGHASDSFDWMETISDEDALQMWELWGLLMPIFFKHLPNNVNIHYARFDYALMEAKVSVPTLTKILLAFASWLNDRLTDQPAIPDIADVFLNIFWKYATDLHSSDLQQLLTTAQQGQNTLFCEKILRALISKWEQLDRATQLLILDYVVKQSYRGRVTSFTTKNSPEEVQLQVCGLSIAGLSTEEVIAKLPHQLMIDCLANVYELSETTDYYLTDRELWGMVLNKLLYQPSAGAFPIAFNQYFFQACIVKKIDPYFPKEPQTYLETLMPLALGNRQAMDEILEVMVILLLDSYDDELKRYVEIILSHGNGSVKQQLLSMIGANLAAFGSDEGILRLPDSIYPELDLLFANELEIFRLQRDFSESKNAVLGYQIKDKLISGINVKAFHSSRLMDGIVKWAKKNERFFEEKELATLKKYADHLFDWGFQQQNELAKQRQAKIRKLSSWREPN